MGRPMPPAAPPSLNNPQFGVCLVDAVSLISITDAVASWHTLAGCGRSLVLAPDWGHGTRRGHPGPFSGTAARVYFITLYVIVDYNRSLLAFRGPKRTLGQDFSGAVLPGCAIRSGQAILAALWSVPPKMAVVQGLGMLRF